MIEPIIRYWIKLHGHNAPIETDNLRNIRNDIKRSSSSLVIVESIYPTYHEFESSEIKREKIPGELSDAQRSNTVSRMFNKINQYEKQVIRKKPARAKPSIKRK